MPYSIILHVVGEPSIIGEVEELPTVTDTLIVVDNPRLKDGKDLHYIEENVVKVIWPIDKISLIEILGSADQDSIIGFVRE